MKYEDLLESHFKYGTTKNDILEREGYQKVLKNVIIAPWWDVEMFEKLNLAITKINDKVYNVKIDEIEFTFVQLKAIGAPIIIEEVLSLGVSDCENILFIGSVGSLDENISIGDIVIPKYSICGTGSCRYLNSNLEDDFGEKYFPNKIEMDLLYNTAHKMCKKHNVKVHLTTNFSVDTIFAQFFHIDKIKSMGANVIEMETAVFFKAAKLANLKACALFCVSDNTVINKSLYSGRTLEEDQYRRNVRYNIIPSIIVDFFKNSK